MKKSNLLLLIALIVVLISILIAGITARTIFYAGFVEGEGNPQQTERSIPSFEKVKVTGNYNVYFTQDSIEKLLLIADANLHEYILTEVVNNELIIRSSKPIRSSNELRIELSALNLTHAEASAGAGFYSRAPLILPMLHLTASGGAKIEIDGIFETLHAYQNAGSNMVLSGRTNHLAIESNAGGRVNAADLEAETASVEANAGASAIVNAKEVEANANAGASIHYIGDPIFHGMQTSAGGNIRRFNR